MTQFIVIGGAGYIGSHVAKELAAQGYGVMVLDNLTKGHRHACNGAEFTEGDLGDRDLLSQVFSQRKIDCVMHFGAFSLVGESVEKPLEYYDNNVARTVSLLSAMSAHGVNRFIFSSSAAVYGEPANTPIPETDPTEPTNPYGRSKLIIEEILEDCDNAHGLKYSSLRYFNAAGADEGGQIGEDHTRGASRHTCFPSSAKWPWDRDRTWTYTATGWDTDDGTCIRDYVHVTDLAEAHILAAERLMDGAESAIYNLGCQTGYSVREIVEISRGVTHHPIPAVEVKRRPGDPAKLVASSEKIVSELGWSPSFGDPERIIETAWKWHKNHPNGFGRA